MVTLNIAELIGTPSAILQKFGLRVYEVVSNLMAEGQNVTLDFSGIMSATSGFFHASVGNLCRDLGAQYASRIFISGLDNPLWREKYDEAIEFANHPERAHQLDSAISQLLAY